MNKITFTVKDVEYAVVRPSPKQERDADIERAYVFGEALKKGAIMTEMLEKYATEQGVWNEEKEAEKKALYKSLAMNEIKLSSRGRLKKSEVREIAIQMKKDRSALMGVLSVLSAMRENTAEGIAEQARFEFLISSCLVYNLTGERVYPTTEDYRNDDDSEVAQEGASKFASMIYGVDPNFAHQLPENKALLKCGFVNDKLGLIDSQGRLINLKGQLIDEEGYLINEHGQRITIDGDIYEELDIDQAEYLDD